jgi:amino acid transporter
MQTSGSNQNAAGGLTLVGGLIAAISVALSWIDFTEAGAADRTFKGTELNAGSMALVGGIVLIIFGIILLVRGARTGGRGSAITAIVIAAFVLGAGAYTALSPADSLVSFEASDVAEFNDVSESIAKAYMEEGFASGDLTADALIGPWVAAAGGLIALLGGILGVANARRIREQQAAAPPAPSAAEPRPAGTPPEA